jgi:hypothetical protein
MNRSFVLVSLLALGACSTTQSSLSDNETARSQLELLKSLEGEWVSTSTMGGETNEAVTTFHVTGAGSAVQETLLKGTDHEMVSMYHIDGGRLMHTHYCAMGNQPRMVAVAPTRHGEIPFEFKDATNMSSMNDMHMHQMKIWVKDANHVEEWWQGWENGKAGEHEAHFVLTRKTAK